MATGLVGLSVTLIGNDMMKEFGEETHGWTCLNRHKTQILLFYVKAHKRVSSDNQDAMFCGNLSASSPVNLVITQDAHEQSSHGGRNGSYARAQQHGFPLTKSDQATATAECPVY